MVRGLRDATAVTSPYFGSRFHELATKGGHGGQHEEGFIPPHQSGPHSTLRRCEKLRSQLEEDLRVLVAAAAAAAAAGAAKKRKRTVSATAAMKEGEKKLADATQIVLLVQKRCTALEQRKSDSHVSNVAEFYAVDVAFLEELLDDPDAEDKETLREELEQAKEHAAEAAVKDKEYRRKLSEALTGKGMGNTNSSGRLTGMGKNQQLQPVLDALKKSKGAGTKAGTKKIKEVEKKIDLSNYNAAYRAEHEVVLKQKRDAKNDEAFKERERERDRLRRLAKKENEGTKEAAGGVTKKRKKN